MIAIVMLCAGGGIVAASPAAGPPAAPRALPRRIVSLNLCADQYLMALADPGQIAALTRFAHDPDISVDAARARHFPYSRGTAEEILALRPDMVVISPWRRGEILALLKGRDVRIVEVADAQDYAGIRTNARAVASLVGHPERGEAMVRAMDAELARIGAPAGRGRTAAHWQRRGFLTGGGTLIDAMMRRAGLVNLATRLGRPPLSRLSIEALVATPPDFLFVDDGADDGDLARDQGSEMLHHPAVRRAIPLRRHLHIPRALAVCGTPGFPRAVAAIDTQIRAADGLAAR